MKKRLAEETIIFISVIKWFALATAVGAIVGLATTGFLWLLKWSTALGNGHPHYFLFMPAAFFASALIIKYIAPDAEGHGTEKVIEAIHKRSGRIKASVVPVKLVATLITIAAGGSVGKEGPCAQIGAGLASLFANIFRCNDRDRKKIVICGISAGFAAVFGTPIAGALFGIEVLFVGSILYEVLLPSFVAGMTSYYISSSLGITYFYRPINFVPVFTESFFTKIALAGIFFGLCSFLLVESLKLFQSLADRIRIWKPLKGLLGGAILIALAMLISNDYLGLGLNHIEGVLQGQPDAWYSAPAKIAFTSITLAFGGSGGIVTPIFFIGSSAGALFAKLMSLDTATFAAIGLVSLLAGAANTPLAASIMAVELFGSRIAPYAATACVISFLMTGHRSVYPSQVFAISKTPSVKIELGKEEDELQMSFDLKSGGVIQSCRALLGRMKRLFSSHSA